MNKKLLNILSCLAFTLLTVSLQAQVKTLNVAKDFFKGSTGLQSIKFDDKSSLIVSSDNDKAVEITCININTTKKWTARVEGYLQDAHVLGKNVVVLVSTDFTFFTRANSTFKAYLLSGENGSVIKEKILFNGNNEYLTLPYTLVSNDRKTFTLTTRETAIKRTMKIGAGTLGAMYTMKKLSSQGNKIKAFNVLTFDENLEAKGAISPDLPEGDYIGLRKTLNGDVYIAVSENKKGITISKYLPNSEKPVKSVTEPFSYYSGLLGMKNLNESISFYTDTLNNNTVYIAGSFKSGDDYISTFNKYDFEADQHKRFKKSFTKAEVKEMEKTYLTVNKDFKKLKLAPAKDLEVIQVVIHEAGYFILLSDYRVTSSSPNSPGLPYSEGIIVFNLDKNLTLKTTSTIPREYIGKFGSDAEVYIKNGSLYVFASHEDNANFVVARLNAVTGKLEDLQLAKPDKAGKTDYACLSNAHITNNVILLPVYDFKTAFGKVKYDVNLYQLGW